MQLLIENQKSTVLDGLSINEAKGDNGTSMMYIEGIFAQAEVLNGNKRVYPKHILENAVKEYNANYLAKGKSIGEFNHPDYPVPKWDNAAIMIKELRMDGNNVYGKALVLDTEKGKHLQALIKGGYNVGVSTRGLGNTKLNESGNTEVTAYQMTAVDVVDNPSAPDAHVNPIYESVNWEQKDGAWVIKESTDKFVEKICSALNKY
jgi:prohead core protein protease|nr:MAG TPA: Prohead core protein serine protease [Ackermannviridae sp.]